jgi:hypothetical protein
MKARLIAIVSAALAFVASPVPIVHAGGGGAGLGDSGAFLLQCYMIEGASKPGQVLALDDQFFPAPPEENPENLPDLSRQNVRLGPAKLVCTPTNGVLTKGDLVADPLGRSFFDVTHAKCYANPPRGDDPHRLVKVTDPLTGAEIVRVLGPRFLCVGAFKDELSQEP